MYELVDVTDDLDIWLNKDPVRPELDSSFKRSAGRFVYALRGHGNDSFGAFCCLAMCNDIPVSTSELDRMTDSRESSEYEYGSIVVVPYSLWRYKRSYGYRLIDLLLKKYRKKPFVRGVVTLSPSTELARNFHIKNGAKVYRSLELNTNYSYLL